MTASAYYHRLRDSQRLLLSQDEVRWHLQVTGSPPQSDVVVDFGCGLQLVPNVMVEMVDVLTELGAKVAAVAGPQWCCGMPVEEEVAGGSLGVVRASVHHLSKFQPRMVFQSCGAWWPNTGKLRDAGEPLPFGLEHLSQLVLDTLQSRADSIAWPQAPTTKVLLHLKAQDATEAERAERPSLSTTDRAVPAILELIPSVEIVGEVEQPAAGRPCDTDTDDDDSILAALSPQERQGVSDELAAQAARAGADVIVCAHHRCYQEWAKFATESLPVRHYISVLADALGLAQPSRYHQCWALPSTDDIVEATAPQWQSWDLSRDEASLIAQEVFPKHPRSRG